MKQIRFFTTHLPVLLLVLLLVPNQFIYGKTISLDEENPVVLSFDDAITQAMDHNAMLQQANLDARIAGAQRNQANAAFLPQVEAAYTALYTNNPLNAFGFKLNQRIVTQEDFNPALLNDPEFSRDYSAQLQLRQPLLNVDAILARRAASQAADSKKYVAQRTSEAVRFQVAQAYLQIALAYQNVEVMSQAEATAASFEQRAQAMSDEGIIQKADLLEAKAYHLNITSKLQMAESGIANSSDQLSLLMGAEIGVIYKVSDLRWTTPNTSVLDVMQRSDLLAYRSGLSAAKSMVQSSKMKWLPRINAFGSYQFNDTEAFKFKEDSYMVGVSLSMTLFDGNQNIQKLRIARYERDKVASKLLHEERAARADYEKAERQLRDLEVELDHANTMVEQTDEAWRIQKNRYNEGLAPTNDLLRVQSQLAERQLMKSMTDFKRNLTIAYLRFLVSQN
ncbi:MAG: TolC family protein [Bacteroidaceae bacterium]